MNAEEVEAWADAYIRAQLDPELFGVEHPLWWAVEKAIYATGNTSGDELFEFILAVLEKDPPDTVIAVLAAGPLEELISCSGRDYIDRIELEAARNPKFRHLLGGVWKASTVDSVWNRIEAVRDSRW